MTSRISHHGHLGHLGHLGHDHDRTGDPPSVTENDRTAPGGSGQVRSWSCQRWYEKALEPDHPDTLRVVQNLGLLYHGRGQIKQAEEMWTRALAGYEKALEPEHLDTLRVVQNLGSLYYGRGQIKQAEEMWTRALAGYEKALEPEHLDTLRVVQNLGS